MKPEPHILFSPFRLDRTNARLWRDDQVIALRPKTFAVLSYLAEHAGQLVRKEELLNAVWPDTRVSDAGLKDYIQEIRKALSDDPKAPRFIETVQRRGYRFIAAVTTTQPVVSSQYPVVSRKQSENSSPQLATGNWQLPTRLVGREAELRQLHRWSDKAANGERQVVFVTGEPGIGKTTLVEAFVEQVTAQSDVRIARGQCIEQYGQGEAYFPVLEALGRLCREQSGEQLLKVLRRYAPTWLGQLSWLLDDAENEKLGQQSKGATQARMLREMAEALEVLTADTPLVLVLEDLHWSDYATLDLMTFLAQRREPARLLLIGTYRPAEVLVSRHPLYSVKQELQIHGHCEELSLGLLTASDIEHYLEARFAVGAIGQSPLQGLAEIVHQRTEGNPLFLVTVVDDLVARGMLAQVEGQWVLKGALEAIEVEIPESLRQMIEKQITRLSPEEQRLLEAASVAGMEFSAAAVAAGSEVDVDQIEEWCEGLARRGQVLHSRGQEQWPDGTVAARYAFVHALYQEVLYERVTASRRCRLHQRIGEREEAAYGERAGERAAELAVHFERGREYRKAVKYLQQAGENAARRSAYQEALSLLTKGLELLQTLLDTPERARQEIPLQLALSAPLWAIKGPATPEAERACIRALELCRQVGETPHLLPVLLSLGALSLNQGKLQPARELAEQSLTLAQRAQDRALLVPAHSLLASTLYFMGELVPALEHLEQGFALYDPQQRCPMFFTQTEPGVFLSSLPASVLGLLGYPDQAVQKIHAALSLAHKLSHPLSLAVALGSAAMVHQARREVQAAQEHAEMAIALSREQGFTFLLAGGTFLRGWALAVQGRAEEGITQMRQGLAAVLATGVEVRLPYNLALLAEAYERVGQVEEGLAVLAEALAMVRKIGQDVSEAELYRLKGQLTLQQQCKVQSAECKVPSTQHLTPSTHAEAEAEACFLKAIEIAQKQQAKSLELRAAMSLSRLWQQQGKKQEARQMLAEIYGWFTEGFDISDLKEAKALLEELA